ncbi:MAG: carbon monoxide dehydrogenase, partial [Actinobacteria bacterium]|nr:carbon monoxide dehydrogenase [Actinomycetota bacterium]
MVKEKRKPDDISEDKAVCEMLINMDPDISTVFERAESMKPCPIGSSIAGICCKNCSMGPCRLKEGKTGLCGATIGTVAARNLARSIAVGASAHSDHGRDLAHLLGLAAQDKAEGVKIK